ncbi:SCO6880 family protein [Longispora sp. NPDC051575]|uniref:SCO6880 family protein n=1 Tax=Longispora sp. NPDC051575 TaxID=3154943 RepID=UPI0034264B9B
MSSTREELQVRTYFGWQQDKVAFLFGLSAQRAVMLGGAVLIAVWPLAVSKIALGALCWPLAAILAGLVFLRLGGRTVDEWLAAFVSFHSNKFRNRHKFLSAAFAPEQTADKTAPKPMDLPGVLAPLTILEAQMPGGGPLAVAHHRLDRTFTAVARVRYPGIGLVDSGRRDQRVAGWGAVLAGLCTEGNPIVRVQALQRIVPESCAALRRWHRDHVSLDAPASAVAITEGLLSSATLATSQRESYLAFTLDARKAAGAIKTAGGGTAAAATVLTRHLRSLAASISGADLQIETWLGPRDLAEVLRTTFDPHSSRHLAERRANGTVYSSATAKTAGDDGPGLAPGVDPALAGPAAAEAQPGVYAHDGAHSVTYWVHDWPRNQVYATVLAPLLGEGSHRRTFSMHIEPLGPREAERDVMRERTARSVAVRMRQKTGQIVPEHEQIALDRARSQDQERAAGHGLVRFTGFLTVTGDRPGANRRRVRCPGGRRRSRPGRGAPDVVRPGPRVRHVGAAARVHPAEEALVAAVSLLRRTKSADLPVADLGQFLAGPTPTAPPTTKAGRGERRREPREIVPPRRGWARPFAGRAPKCPPIPEFRGSTGQVQGLYPWLYGQSVPPVGAYLGVDTQSGGSFSCHPIEWLQRGMITNPNMIVTGVPGTGKSATIKAIALRLIGYGVKAFVLGDIKNEYAPLARYLGVEPVELGLGLRARLNPLDSGPLGDNLPSDPEDLRERLEEIHRRRISLLSSLLVMRLGRNLTPTEEAALSLAIQEASGETVGNTRLVDPTIPQVWALLRDPTPDMARELRVRGEDIAELREMIRPAADALGNMVQGSLSGLFDGPTTVRPDFNAPIQTVDLSRIDGRGDETVAMTLACVSSWGQAAISMPGGPLRLMIRDELWRAMRIPAMVRKLDSDLRLSRNDGKIELLSTHRLSDFEAVGAAGSEEVTIASNLIASCDVRVLLRQDTAPLQMTKEAIGLTDTECAHIASWSGGQVGRALWKIGRSESQIVQTVLSPVERQLYYTNERMALAR